MESKKLRVCAYTRVSTKKNEQATSLETQKLYYQEFIESHDEWEYCGIYSDATTGTKLTRPGFSAMLRKCGIVIDDSKNKFEIKLLTIPSEYDLIVIKNTSRFARSADAPSLVEKLRLKNVFVYFETLGKSTEEIDNDLLINIMFQIDKNYSSALSKNARLSYIRAIELRGTIFTSKILFGYKKIGKGDEATLVPESAEHIDIINKIFKWYIEGKGFRVIAKLVDEAGFKSKKLRKDGTFAPIGKHGIKRIITNERYMGYVQVPIRTGNEGIGKIERKEGNYRLKKSDNITPIISEELFKQANDVLNNKPLTKKNKGKKGYSAKYSKYLICANCYKHFIKAAGYKGKALYVCTVKRNQSASVCTMPYLTEQFIDEQLEILAKDIVSDDDELRRESLLMKIENFKFGFIYNYTHSDNAEQIKMLKQKKDELDAAVKHTVSLRYKVSETVLVETLNSYSAEIEATNTALDFCLNLHENLKKNIAICDNYLNEIKKLDIPKKYNASTLLEYISYILVYELPLPPHRKQSLNNNVRLELVTRASDKLSELDSVFLDTLERYPDPSTQYYNGFDEETKKELLKLYNS